MKRSIKYFEISIILVVFVSMTFCNLNNIFLSDNKKRIERTPNESIRNDYILGQDNASNLELGTKEISNLQQEYSLMDVTIIPNVTMGGIVRSTDVLFVTFSSLVYRIEYFFGDIGNPQWIIDNRTNINNLTLDVPDLPVNEDQRQLYLGIKVFDDLDDQIQIEYFDFILDDNWVEILSITNQGKVKGGQEIKLSLDPDPRYGPDSIGGIAWRWDGGSSSGASKIFAPPDDGTHTLYLSITDPLGRLQTQAPLEYYYYIDNTPPTITPLVNFGDVLKAGTVITFENKTPIDTGDPFTDIISWTFTYPALNLSFVNQWPSVPSPADTYELQVTAKDRLNNTANSVYAVKAGIAIYGTSINQFKFSRPNMPLIVNISEIPISQNYTWYRLATGTLISSSNSTPPNTPTDPGTYELYIHVTDTTGRSDTLIDQITIDGSPFKFSFSDPSNNSQHLSSVRINLHFNETAIDEFFIYHWDDNINKTGQSELFLPSSAGKHNLTVFSGDRAENYIITKLSFIKHLSQSLVAPKGNFSVVDPGFNVSIQFSEPPFHIEIHWDNSPSNGSLTDSPATSAPHALNVTTISTLGVVTTYYYMFTVKILAILHNQTEYQRLKVDTPIHLNFTETPSNWRYRWNEINDASLIWKYDKNPVIPSGTKTHYLDIEMDNNEGTAFRQRLYFVGDDTLPQIISINPLTSKTLDSAIVIRSGTNISIQVSDNLCNTVEECLQNLKYSFNGLLNSTIDLTDITQSLPYRIYLPELLPIPIDDSITNITFYLQDIVGHTFTTTYYYEIDDLAPFITESLHNNNTELQVPAILSYNLSEVTSGRLIIQKGTEVVYNNTFNSKSKIDIDSWVIGYANTTLLVELTLQDLLGNSRSIFFVYTTKDKSLLIEYIGNTLITSGSPIEFTINKPLVFQSTSWYDENHILVSSALSLNTTAPSNIHGDYLLHYNVTDNQGIWYNGTINTFIDAKAPSLTSNYQKYNASNQFVIPITVTNPINSTHPFTDINVFPNQSIVFSFNDDYFSQAKITINERINGNSYTNSLLVNNPIFNYQIKTNTTLIIFEFELHDELGNNQKFYLNLNIYQPNDENLDVPIPDEGLDFENLVFWAGLGFLVISLGAFVVTNWDKIKNYKK